MRLICTNSATLQPPISTSCEQGIPLPLIMAKTRHRNPRTAMRYVRPGAEAVAELTALLEPLWFRIGAYWYPRGGMPIDVFWQSGPPPEGVWIPAQEVAPYRGRG